MNSISFLIKNMVFLAPTFFCVVAVKAQLNVSKEVFTKADTLRGSLRSEREAYDVHYYHLTVAVDINKKYIEGNNLFVFSVVHDMKRLQFDLFPNMQIEQVSYQGKPLSYTREEGAVFVDFPKKIKKGVTDSIRVYFNGHPVEAKKAPWDGGFVYSHDLNGNPWVATACQGLGASAWWPNKDHQSDEADSVLMSVIIPDTLMDVSNGRLRHIKMLSNSKKQVDWFVASPINNYSISLNIGDYVHLPTRSYAGKAGDLSVDYYVLRGNEEKAASHFDQNVMPMLKCFENWFGAYPFYKDGYKLIETPYLGMEHQSGIAYGNDYMNGYKGKDLSGTGHGSNWDFIIIHESGHEWFGNNITAKDIADMWIHESFTTYSEALFVASQQGEEAGAAYIKGLRANILNDRPIIGFYGVNKEGSGDMYYKGANMLHSLRTVVNNDERWKKMLIGLNETFRWKTTTTENVIAFMNKTLGHDYTPVFNQYLRHTKIPVLVLKQEGTTVFCRWNASVKNFNLPVRFKTAKSETWQYAYPSSEFKPLVNGKLNQVIIDTDNLYIGVDR